MTTLVAGSEVSSKAVNRHHITETLSSGDMGVIFKAEDADPDRE